MRAATARCSIPKTASGYASTPITLLSFNGTNGSGPWASLTADGKGDLFGTTTAGGANGDGTVFEIPKTACGYGTPITLLNFNGTNGSGPYGSLIIDAKGDLFGTTQFGGASGDGTVFEIPKTACGYASTPITLLSFNGTNGADPFNLTADGNGDLFGTTTAGGANGDGTVFEITGSGFVTLADQRHNRHRHRGLNDRDHDSCELSGSGKSTNDPQPYDSIAGVDLRHYMDPAGMGVGVSSTLGYSHSDSNTGGVLAAGDGNHLANVALFGQYMSSSFVAASDGHGGTLISDPPLTAHPLLSLPHG